MSRLFLTLSAVAGLFFASACRARRSSSDAARSDFKAAPPRAARSTAENTWNLDLSTGGRVSIQLRPDVAPNTVERIKTLTRQGFYNGLTFLRVIEGFMAQGGDPNNTGTGGSPLPNLKAEINGLLHVRGAVAHGPRAGPEQRQQPVLHHVRAAAEHGPQLYRVRPGDPRHELRRRDRARRAAAGADPDRPRLARLGQCRRR